MASPDTLQSSQLSELQLLRNENVKLREDLDDCKVKLLTYLREDDGVPDATIRKEYENLSTAIESWIDEVLYKETKDFQQVWSAMLSVEAKQRNLLALGLYAETGLEDVRNGVRMYNADVQRIDWLGKQSHCNVFIVSLVLWRFLERNIFAHQFPIGTAEVDAKGLRFDGSGLLQNVYNVLAREEGDQGRALGDLGGGRREEDTGEQESEDENERSAPARQAKAEQIAQLITRHAPKLEELYLRNDDPFSGDVVVAFKAQTGNVYNS
ncbi:hypothetical protein LTR36_003231 [Oleoguttula mirabilis]|uniref:Uncharacterized protein n=1 Tax=Oleoguttula mirabilis TaxID=1507867 RepID=A0AAV9JY27_9PEZI|nr:hypothetical protein LTR36_003231 [Oleoguttula mirabilis]